MTRTATFGYRERRSPGSASGSGGSPPYSSRSSLERVMPALRTPSTSPAIRAYAGELTAWRDEAKLTKAELSRLLGYTAQYVGQVEGCRNKPSKRFSEDCDTFFKTNGSFTRLWENIADTRHAPVTLPGFSEYCEREQEACSIKISCGLLLNGLFQTPDTIQAIMRLVNDPETAAERTAERLVRQTRVLEREDPPQIFLVLDEMVLRRPMGSVEEHRAQLRHLLDLAERPHIVMQVVPFDSRYYPGLTGAFNALGFEDGSQAAYIEVTGSGRLVDDPAQAAGFTATFDLIRSHALRECDSLSMTRTVLEEL